MRNFCLDAKILESIKDFNVRTQEDQNTAAITTKYLTNYIIRNVMENIHFLEVSQDNFIVPQSEFITLRCLHDRDHKNITEGDNHDNVNPSFDIEIGVRSSKETFFGFVFSISFWYAQDWVNIATFVGNF